MVKWSAIVASIKMACFSALSGFSMIDVCIMATTGKVLFGV